MQHVLTMYMAVMIFFYNIQILIRVCYDHRNLTAVTFLFDFFFLKGYKKLPFFTQSPCCT